MERAGKSYWTERRTIKDNTASHMQVVQDWLNKVPLWSESASSLSHDDIPAELEPAQPSDLEQFDLPDDNVFHDCMEHDDNSQCPLEHVESDPHRSSRPIHNVNDMIGIDCSKSSNHDCDLFDDSDSIDHESDASSWYSYAASDCDPDSRMDGNPDRGENTEDLPSELATWATDYSISHAALGRLLGLLKTCVPDLPKDPRSLLGTQINYVIQEIAGGAVLPLWYC